MFVYYAHIRNVLRERYYIKGLVYTLYTLLLLIIFLVGTITVVYYRKGTFCKSALHVACTVPRRGNTVVYGVT